MQYDEWRQFLQQRGAIAVMPYGALSQPCPKCEEHKGYGVSSDGHAYCRACGWGTATDFPFTNRPYQLLDKYGNPEAAPLEAGFVGCPQCKFPAIDSKFPVYKRGDPDTQYVYWYCKKCGWEQLDLMTEEVTNE